MSSKSDNVFIAPGSKHSILLSFNQNDFKCRGIFSYLKSVYVIHIYEYKQALYTWKSFKFRILSVERFAVYNIDVNWFQV